MVTRAKRAAVTRAVVCVETGQGLYEVKMRSGETIDVMADTLQHAIEKHARFIKQKASADPELREHLQPESVTLKSHVWLV